MFRHELSGAFGALTRSQADVYKALHVYRKAANQFVTQAQRLDDQEALLYGDALRLAVEAALHQYTLALLDVERMRKERRIG